MKTRMLAGLGAMVLIGGLALAADAPKPHGARPDGAPKPIAEGDRPVRPPEGERPGQDVIRAITVAVTAPWAVNDAEMQTLVDKVVADRKIVLADEKARLEAFDKVIVAGRTGDREAVKAAHEAMKPFNDKLIEDAKTMGEDLRALVERLKTLRPEAPEGAARPEARE